MRSRISGARAAVLDVQRLHPVPQACVQQLGIGDHGLHVRHADLAELHEQLVVPLAFVGALPPDAEREPFGVRRGADPQGGGPDEFLVGDGAAGGEEVFGRLQVGQGKLDLSVGRSIGGQVGGELALDERLVALGEDELARSVAAVRNMQDGQQSEVALAELVTWIQAQTSP